MSVEPTAHDVLSGLGAWLNQHPGNAHFRKIIEEQKSIYVAGTKKQKMNISKAIVEAIYSKEPPGRFLKKCPETGQWKELSTKEVAEKVTQSMSCAARGESLKQQRKERHRRSRSRSLPSWTLPSPSFQPRGDAGTVSSQPSDQPTNNQSEAGNVESFVNCAVDTTNAESAVGNGDGHTGSASNDLPFPGAFNRQQEPLLSSTNTALPTTSGAPLNVNQSGLTQVLAQAHQQQQLHDQQQQQQQQQQRVLGQLQLQATQQLSPASLHGLPQLLAHQQQQTLPLPNPPHIPGQISLGLPNSLPSSALAASYPQTFAPSPAQPNDILLQSHSINYSIGSQPQLATSDISQQPMQPQSQHHTNAHLLGMLDNVHQMDQVRCSLAQQQQQLLVLSLIASNQLLLQQQQLQQQAAQQEYLHVNPLHPAWQTAPLRQNPNLNLQTINPPINTQPSVNAAASSSMKDDSEDE